MVDIFWTICSALLLMISLIGCFLPVLPGPPVGYIGLLFLQLKSSPPFDTSFLITWLIIVLAVTGIDYFIPIVGAKKFGGSKAGIYGSIVGLILGIFFFPPFGIIVGPMLGAAAGELLVGKQGKEAIKSGIGTFIGFIFGTLIKVVTCSILCFHFLKSL